MLPSKLLHSPFILELFLENILYFLRKLPNGNRFLSNWEGMSTEYDTILAFGTIDVAKLVIQLKFHLLQVAFQRNICKGTSDTY